MNKILTKFLTFSVGLAMAIGVGVALKGNETRGARAANGNLVSGGDMPNGVGTTGWKTSGTGTYSGNGVKFDGEGDYVISDDISSYSLTNITVKIKAGYNGSKGSVLSITALGSDKSTSLASTTFTPSETYTSQTTLNAFPLTASSKIYYVRVKMDSKTSNIGMKYCAVFDNTPAQSFTITYNPNDGSVTPTSESIASGGHPTFPTPTKDNCIFNGWKTDGDNTLYTSDNASSYTVTKAVTFVAQWTDAYTITYSPNGGSVTPTSESIASGGHPAFPTPTKENCIFDGWKTDGDDTLYTSVNASSYTVSAAATFTAQWTSYTSAKYTVESTSSVTPSGTRPEGSNATYSQTHSTTSQMTGGNSITLTLSGYEGCTIIGITLEMKSNKSAGAGSLSLKVGNTTISSISDSAFNSSNWYGSWSTSYVSFDKSVTRTKVTNNNNVVLYIAASANSLYFQAATIKYLPSTDPKVKITTEETNLIYDGSNSQTVEFTATATNFHDEEITYDWISSDTDVIGVENVGSASSANLLILGAGSSEITVYAHSENYNATSTKIVLTVTNETYSGTLTITSEDWCDINGGGTITYSLTGNTHPMDVATFTSDDTSVIRFNDAHNAAFISGATPGQSATVTVTLSSSTYSLESYAKTITITLTDPNVVTGVKFSGNVKNKTINFGGTNTLTAVLESRGDPVDKLVSWESANTDIVVVNTESTALTMSLTPINVGTTTVTVTTHDGGFTAVCNVTVNSPAGKVLESISVELGEDARDDYYDDETEVDLADISLYATYSHPSYPTYSETSLIANDDSGVTWTLDLANSKVEVQYEGKETSFDITVSERPPVSTFTSSEHTDFADGKIYQIDEIKYTVVKNEAANAPTYNTTYGDCRLYAKSYIQLEASSRIKSIDSIVVKYGAAEKDNHRQFDLNVDYTETYNDEKDLSTVTINEEATTLQLSVPDVSGYQLRFYYLEVNYTFYESEDKDVTDVEVTPSSLTLESGESGLLAVTVLPVDARDLSVTWSVVDASPEGCVTVDSKGKVTGVAIGTATVVATSVDQPTISDSCSVTVIQGPDVKCEVTEEILPGLVEISGTDFDVDYSTTDHGYDTSLGARFGSNKNEAGTVIFTTINNSFAKTDLRVVVQASYSGTGSNPYVSASIGSTSLGQQALTKENATYEFVYPTSRAVASDSSDLVTVTLHNGNGAVYLKELKVYATESSSPLNDFCTNSLRMNSYDPGGTEGSTAGDNSCKAWWSGVKAAYNALTDEQKELFWSKDEYAAAGARLTEWARINNESIDPSTYSLKPYNNHRLILNTNISVSSIIVIISSIVAIASFAGYFYYKKKKDN